MTLSSSNNPTVALDERLAALVGAESRTMTSFRGKSISRLIEARPAFQAYMARIDGRASIQKVWAEDAAMVVEHEAAAAGLKVAS